jgi:holo-[acyl-carrier protein] synthase
VSRRSADPGQASLPPVALPAGTSELGIDIVRVARIAGAMTRFGERFSRRVLTEAERRYVRNRPETFAGRWAAKEAVSKVLGLGVRGIGWREIEVERLPTGQPSIRLHGRAATRADQLGMGRVAVSISHESDYAIAIAFGVRTAGGRYVFPLDIDARLDDRERQLLARFERLRALEAATRSLADREPSAAPDSDLAGPAGGLDDRAPRPTPGGDGRAPGPAGSVTGGAGPADG